MLGDPYDSHPSTRCPGDVELRCVTVRYSDGAIYEGPLSNGAAHGDGVCVFPSGTVCIGHFAAGFVDGDADVLYPNGLFFSGAFSRSEANGRGWLWFGDRLTRGRWLAGDLAEETDAHEAFGGRAALLRPALDALRGGLRRLLSSAQVARAAGRMAEPMVRAPKGDALVRRAHNENGARQMLCNGASPHAIFACAAPSTIEFFSFAQWLKFTAMFLLPFVSLPQWPWSPFRSGMLEMEREFVLSGASLQRELDPPMASLYVTSVAFFCHVASIALVAAKGRLGAAHAGDLTLAEMCVPCVLWLANGLVGGAYNSYTRVAHALERLDRRLTPRLSAFAAGVVDARANVCIYTWDDEGRGKVTNMHYRYRWLVAAVLVGVGMSFAAPVTRRGFSHTLFGREGLEMAAALLAFFSCLLFSATLAYYIMKMTDMQRQVLGQMRVITRLAYLEDRSLLRPSERLSEKFNFEEPLNTSDVFSGVTGWYVVRSLVLYAAACSNHRARSLAFSYFFLVVFCGFLVIIGDLIYMTAAGYDRSGTYYSTGHSYGVILCVVWGLLLQRHLYVSAGTVEECKCHLYLLDVASVYHLARRHPVGDLSGDLIAKCRQMIETHEQLPSLFTVRITPLVVVGVVFVHLAALVSIALQLAIAIYYR